MISTWLVEEMVLKRDNAPVNHIIQAIGSSSVEKGHAFAAKSCPEATPKVYGTYEELYQDADVDVIYIGTPHAFHKKHCLEAIKAGKAVLCEKAFTLNAKEAQEVLDAARDKGVYVAEAMWLRHRPLVQKLRSVIHEEKAIGEPFRMFSDFGLDLDIPSLPQSSRYRDPDLGAGSLLDIGIYSLTWALLTMDAGTPSNSETPKIHALQSFVEGIEVTSSVLLSFPSTGRQAITTSTTNINRGPGVIARVDGRDGYIEVEGPGGSMPQSFTVYKKTPPGSVKKHELAQKFDYPEPGRGFIHEIDNTGKDIIDGRQQSTIMPWSETINVMKIMDEIRKQGGTKYSVDETE